MEYDKPMSGADVLVRLDPELKQRLEEIAARSGRSPAELAHDAISSFVTGDDWIRAAVEEGLREADAGLFLSEEEQAAAYKRWTS